MAEISGRKQKRLEMPGRYVVTIDCAGDLTEGEMLLMKEWFVAEVFGLAVEMGFVGDRPDAWVSDRA